MRPGQQCRGAKLTSAHIKNTRGGVTVAVRVVTKASIVGVFSRGTKYIGGRNKPYKKDFFLNQCSFFFVFFKSFLGSFPPPMYLAPQLKTLTMLAFVTTLTGTATRPLVFLM